MNSNQLCSDVTKVTWQSFHAFLYAAGDTAAHLNGQRKIDLLQGVC